MKKNFFLLVVMVLAILLMGCGSKSVNDSSETNTSSELNMQESKAHDFNELNNQQITIHDYVLSIPDNWEERNSDEDLKYFYPDGKNTALLMIQYQNASIDLSDANNRQSCINDFSDGLENTGLNNFVDYSTGNFNCEGHTGFLHIFSFQDNNNIFDGKLSAISNSTGTLFIVFAEQRNIPLSYADDFLHILTSVEIPKSSSESPESLPESTTESVNSTASETEPMENTAESTPPAEETTTNSPINLPTISKSEFDALTNGMSYDEVVEIIGGSGEVLSETGSPGDAYYTVMYMWEGEGELGANANVMFQDNKLISKAQYGLR